MQQRSKPFTLLKSFPQSFLCNRRKATSDSSKTNFSRSWKSVVGLEIHAQLSTKSKLFSAASASYGAPPNTSVSLFDASEPGTLPVLNKTAVELAVISALAFGCKINPVSYFDRKHYFYSDLPAGYQITQQRLPFAEDGKVEYAVFQPGIHNKPYYKTSKIQKIQLEQDSGKSLHESSDRKSYIDLNRAGIALIEIVFDPDIENGEEASALVKEVIKIFERLGSCSCKLEEGALRVDANVSVCNENGEFGIRTEIKNVGSINGVKHAVQCEVKRQLDIIKHGGVVQNQTLAWDAENHKILVVRDKEEKQDYRFMPEPNLPPLRLLIDEYSENIHKNAKIKQPILNLRYLKDAIPSLPQYERFFLIQKHGLTDIFAYNLVNQDKLLRYFKEIMLENPSRNPRTAYLLLMYQFLTALKQKNLDLDDCSVSASHLGQIVDLLQSKRISKMTSDNLVEEIVGQKNPLTPLEIVEKNNLEIISDANELRKICLRVIEREQIALDAYKKRKKKSIYNGLVRKAIEESKFRADTQVLPGIMTEVLDELDNEK